MDVEELVKACIKSIKAPIAPGELILIQPGKWRANQTTKRFMGSHGPIGTIISEEDGGQLAIRYNATELLDWLAHESAISPRVKRIIKQETGESA